MNESARGRKKKNRKKLWGTAIAVPFVLLLGVIVFQNNRDIFSSAGDAVMPVSEQRTADPVITKPDLPAHVVEETSETVTVAKDVKVAVSTVQPSAVKVTVSVADSAAGATDGIGMRSLDLPDIKFRALDRPGIEIFLALQFWFEDDALNHEILLKRQDITVIVRKIMRSRELSSIESGQLRRELRSGINELLDNGQIADVVVKDFRIEEVK